MAAVRCYLKDEVLYISHEAYKKGVEQDHTVDFVSKHIPMIEQFVIRADSAEPKSISYLQRHGFPRIEGVKKWQNSITEGVRWMRGLKRIVIHPRCENAAKEFRLYSHKVDKRTGDILPNIVDANNHIIDAIRYALQQLIKQIGTTTTGQVTGLY